MRNDKMLHQMCYHEKTKSWFRVTKHGEYLTDVQKLKFSWDEGGYPIPYVYALLHTNDLHFYPWTMGDKE